MKLQTLQDAELYLDGFVNRERQVSYDYERLGLGRIEALLGALGNPHKGLPCIHVAGSNGKGSVALAAEQLLRAAGCRTGTFTSPHLESWRERFRIAGEPVQPERLVEALNAMQPGLERLRADPALCPSFFDVSTALALWLFRESGVDAGVIEVGLGGRIDSTNLVESSVAVVTSIELEHTDKLGDTHEQIASEKAGIAKPGVPLLHGPLSPEAWGAVAAAAVAQDAPLEEVELRESVLDANGVRFQMADGRTVHSGVLGDHQATNLALAIRAVELFLGRDLSAKELSALADLKLPARQERIGRVILDSAHTTGAAASLARTLDRIAPSDPRVLVVSISSDKDAAGMLLELGRGARACVVTTVEPTRSRDPEELLPIAWASGIEQVEAVPEPIAALERALELAGEDAWLVVAGSVYFAGAVREHLLAKVQ
ncbi:MAG: bifunctional folylpolyglutamate synthase/dihydrofolate synthase [bacterium]|nr:bifunctional folylpolyglutamate synthase/dihydrofolate synthase [bacterium]